MRIGLQGIVKRFGSFTALEGVDLTVGHGELVALLGPSGSGKTTLLRVIAGLEAPDEGVVSFDGDDATTREVRERRVGFVFQHYALFRHLTVFENVAFGLRVLPRRERLPARELRSRVEGLLELVQLTSQAGRYPSQLSGGQRQRVALARALAVQPRVLLLDEPFGALDAKVRKELRRWLRRLHDNIPLTSVFVTHDQEEALELADRVVVMNHGRLEQVGTPSEVYHQPSSPFVYRFLGDVNLFHGRVDGDRVHLLPPARDDGRDAGVMYVRPHMLEIDHAPIEPGAFPATVQYVNPAGPTVKVELLADWGEPVLVELPQERYRTLQLTRNARVYVRAREANTFGPAAPTVKTV